MAWLRRLSLTGSKQDKQSSGSNKCSNLSRRSWPFRKVSMTPEDEDELEESCPTEDLKRVSVIRPPVGGGEYKGALPSGQSLTPRQGKCLFEDSINEDLLVQIFLNLSLEVGTLSPSLSCTWYYLCLGRCQDATHLACGYIINLGRCAGVDAARCWRQPAVVRASNQRCCVATSSGRSGPALCVATNEGSRQLPHCGLAALQLQLARQPRTGCWRDQLQWPCHEGWVCSNSCYVHPHMPSCFGFECRVEGCTLCACYWSESG